MANEIRLDALLQVTNGEFVFPLVGGSYTFDQTTAGGGAPGYISLAADTETTVDLSELTGEGWLWMKNLDATANVNWGPDSTGLVTIGTMEPGEPALFRMNGSATLILEAIGATADVQIYVIED